MFRFVCPMCQHSMEVAESKAGSKTRCARCGQKLLIPMPPQHSRGKKKSVAGPGGRGRLARYGVGAALLSGVVFGVYYFVYLPITEASAGRVMEVRNFARSSAERAVRDTLMKHVLKPKDVKFERWGPHLFRREWESMLRLADANNRDEAEKLVKIKSFDAIVRVAYSIPEMATISGIKGENSAGSHDLLFAVKGPYVAQLDGLTGGDDWKQQFEQKVLRSQSGGDSSSDKSRGR